MKTRGRGNIKLDHEKSGEDEAVEININIFLSCYAGWKHLLGQVNIRGR